MFFSIQEIGSIEEACIMATDPVCYTNVDEENTRFETEYKGERYWFCTAFCMRKFEENPEKYAKLARSLDLDPNITC